MFSQTIINYTNNEPKQKLNKASVLITTPIAVISKPQMPVIWLNNNDSYSYALLNLATVPQFLCWIFLFAHSLRSMLHAIFTLLRCVLFGVTVRLLNMLCLRRLCRLTLCTHRLVHVSFHWLKPESLQSTCLHILTHPVEKLTWTQLYHSFFIPFESN